MDNQPGKSKAIASMVCGIVGLVFCVFLSWTGPFAFIGLICSLVGLILGVKAKKEIPEGAPTGAATAGIVCSTIALALGAVVLVVCTICIGSLASLSSLSSLY